VWTGATPGAIPLRQKADALPFWRQEQPSPTWQPRDTPQLLCFTFFIEIEFSVGTSCLEGFRAKGSV
jgi:hypothetical protein